MVKLLELIKPLNRPIVIFSENLKNDPFSTLIYNIKRDQTEACAVNLPWMGDKEDDLLEDIAFVTKSTLVDNEEINLENLKLEHLGSCRKIVIGKDTT